MATTVLDAVVSVLSAAPAPLSLRDIHARIGEQGLFTFRAKDSLGIVRSAILRHLRSVQSESATSARVRKVGKDTYALP